MGVRNDRERENQRQRGTSTDQRQEGKRQRERERRFSRGGKRRKRRERGERRRQRLRVAMEGGIQREEISSERRDSVRILYNRSTVRRPTKYYVQLRNDKRYPGMMPLGGRISSGEGEGVDF